MLYTALLEAVQVANCEKELSLVILNEVLRTSAI